MWYDQTHTIVFLTPFLLPQIPLYGEYPPWKVYEQLITDNQSKTENQFYISL